MASLKPTLVPSKPYTPWQVRFPTGRRYFKTEELALEAISDYRKGQIEQRMTVRDLDEYRHAKQLLGETSLLAAVRFYLEHNHAITGTATVDDALALRDAKVAKASETFRAAYKSYVKVFKEAFPGPTLLVNISRNQLASFLETLSVWQQVNLGRWCRAFFNEAVRGGLLVKSPMANVEIAPVPSKPPEFLSLDEIEGLLSWAKEESPKQLPALALQIFFGVRTEELSRPYGTVSGRPRRPLEWGDIQFGTAIDVAAAVAKTEERRVVDHWPAAASAWLRPYFNEDGSPKADPKDRVAPKSYRGNKSRIFELAKAWMEENRGVPLRASQNVLRHTFATYMVAYWQSAERVALLMGHHGSDLLFRHYRNYVTEEQGKAFVGLGVPKISKVAA